MAHREDVNGDDLLVSIIQVEMENLDPGLEQAGSATLTKNPYECVPIEGSDEIAIVSAKG